MIYKNNALIANEWLTDKKLICYVLNCSGSSLAINKYFGLMTVKQTSKENWISHNKILHTQNWWWICIVLLCLILVVLQSIFIPFVYITWSVSKLLYTCVLNFFHFLLWYQFMIAVHKMVIVYKTEGKNSISNAWDGIFAYFSTLSLLFFISSNRHPLADSKKALCHTTNIIHIPKE